MPCSAAIVIMVCAPCRHKLDSEHGHLRRVVIASVERPSRDWRDPEGDSDVLPVSMLRIAVLREGCLREFTVDLVNAFTARHPGAPVLKS